MERQAGNRQRGMTIVMLALFVVVLFVFAALAVDVGVLYTARTSAQHVADAAALAGAFTFTVPAATQPLAAQNAAIHIAAQNKVMGQAITLAPGAKGASNSVYVDTANHRVTVTVSRLASSGNGVATLFMNVWPAWGGSASVQAIATAEGGSTNGAATVGSLCVKPIFIPNTIFSSLSPAAACSARPPEVLFDPATGAVSAWAQANITNGMRVTIKPGDPNQALLPSQFYALNIGGPGANQFGCGLGQCLNYCGVANALRCGSSYQVQTGNMTGQTICGINTLIGSPPGYTYVSLGQYQNVATGQYSDTAPGLVIAPVWDNCNPLQQITSGNVGQSVQVYGFIELFVDSVTQQGNSCNGNGNGGGGGGGGNPNGTVTAHVIQKLTCAGVGGGGGSGGSGPTSGTGPLGQPVRLVQTP